jgi:MFS family permease
MTLTVDPVAQRLGKLYYGWRILGVTMTLSFFATVMSQFFTGAMLRHIEESTGWNRSSITFAVTIGTVVGGLLSPTFGHLADRYGPRVISSAGVLIAAAAMAAVGLSGSAHIAVFYVAYLVGRTATQNAVGGVTAQTTMVNWFKRMRGRSIGLLTMGVPLGGAILVPLSQLAIDNGVSWEAVYFGFAAVMTLVLFPLAVLVLRRRPEDMGLLPDGDASEQDRPDLVRARQAWRRRQSRFDPARLIFLDESGAKTNLTRLRARSQRGERAHASCPAGHWQTMTMISSIRLDGSTACMALEGTTDTETFGAYVRAVLVPTLRPGDIVIMDNLSPHKSEPTLAMIAAAGAEALFLPPYSPDFNPIEKMWSKIKALLRSAEARTVAELISAIGQALKKITPQDALGWFTSCGYSFC